MDPNPDPSAEEIAELKQQIDAMDRQIGLHRGTIVMQQRIVDAMLQARKLLSLIVENLCKNILNDRLVEAKILAQTVLASLKSEPLSGHREPRPKTPEPELTFPPEPDPSDSGSPTPSTNTSSDPVPPASEPTISPIS